MLSTSSMSEIAASLCAVADDPAALPSPPPLPPPVRNPGCPFTQGQPLYASCCTVLLYFSRYCAIRLKMIFYFLCLCFMYYLCEKYYNPIIVLYCIADCVSGVLG